MVFGVDKIKKAQTDFSPMRNRLGCAFDLQAQNLYGKAAHQIGHTREISDTTN